MPPHAETDPEATPRPYPRRLTEEVGPIGEILRSALVESATAERGSGSFRRLALAAQRRGSSWARTLGVLVLLILVGGVAWFVTTRIRMATTQSAAPVVTERAPPPAAVPPPRPATPVPPKPAPEPPPSPAPADTTHGWHALGRGAITLGAIEVTPLSPTAASWRFGRSAVTLRVDEGQVMLAPAGGAEPGRVHVELGAINLRARSARFIVSRGGGGTKVEVARGVVRLKRGRRTVAVLRTGEHVTLDERKTGEGARTDASALAWIEALVAAGRSDDALAESERLVARDRGLEGLRRLHHIRGGLFRDRGDLARAEVELGLASVGTDTLASDALLDRADCLDALGRTTEAALAYRTYLGRAGARARRAIEERLARLEAAGPR